MKKGFTLLELLVVLAVLLLLTGVLLPSLRRAKLRAKILSVNSDLRQIGLGLECYFFEHKKYPPTREDCNTGSLEDHLFQLPPELADGDYLPQTDRQQAMAVRMEDRFHPGHTYKYRSVGECVRDRDRIDKWIKSRLWVPNGFPAASTAAGLEEDQGQWYEEPDQSPVSWIVFSLGPRFDEQTLRDAVNNRYPVPRQIWYNSHEDKGLLVRLHLKNGNEIGSF